LFSIVVDFPWFDEVGVFVVSGQWSVPIASIVALVFLIQVPGTTQRQEQLDIGQEPHEDVEGNDAADSDTDEFGDVVLGLSIH
jgi:hypothetical protein